jgi:response regulator RpfG family c-di-GMP phosphodiesterase
MMNLPARNRRVLYVDDEQPLLSSFVSMLRKEDVEVHTLNDPTRIDTVLTQVGPFALVVSDQRMPGKDGAAVLETVARTHPETIRIMLTGHADFDATLRALNQGGISKFVSKPWNDDDLCCLIRDAITRYNLTTQNAYLLNALAEQNIALSRLLDGTVAQTVSLLGDLISYVTPTAGAFAERSKRLGTAALALYPEIDEQERWDILRALDLFCLGLAVLPAWVQVTINKHGLGALDRFPVAKNHHILAAGLLERIPQFENVSRIIHFIERDFDGTGEPGGEPLTGRDIPFGARLLHILVDIEKHSSPNFKGAEVLEHMMHHNGKYDNEIIARMIGAPRGSGSGGFKATVQVSALLPGMILLDDLVTNAGNCLLRAPATLTETSITIILQWHQSDAIIGPVRVITQQ